MDCGFAVVSANAGRSDVSEQWLALAASAERGAIPTRPKARIEIVLKSIKFNRILHPNRESALPLSQEAIS